ncbi:hypothetical protein [Pedobacter punctiformis]|uniref:Uncharacterized protein n=1 Tax=Pedobacter punctiformis TaxID=3004097 RepID=A0ABT4L6X3_9SPHI|nr:hypothetical protein [Pedobacter sp. HCMS5-2]MCZ4243673.1 hypothetical protein [Pedobacter sp. HCMS5-2]
MKKFILTFCLIFAGLLVFAQQDTSAYQIQRTKINSLLNERSAKFGQYDQSLNEKTGIFGWQTKKDIKNSNEILRQIVLNDNDIFKELKILMDYKDLQNQKVVVDANNSEERIENYMRTIKKLQDQNTQLKSEVTGNTGFKNISVYIIVFLILVMSGGTYFFYKKLKKYEKSNF